MRKLFFLLGFILVGCDSFPGPSIRSEFATNVILNISYTDGKKFSHEWMPCQTMHLGATEAGKWGIKSQENVFIDRITIEKNGAIVHDFDQQKIKEIVEGEEAEKSTLLIVDESGVRSSIGSPCSLQK